MTSNVDLKLQRGENRQARQMDREEARRWRTYAREIERERNRKGWRERGLERERDYLLQLLFLLQLAFTARSLPIRHRRRLLRSGVQQLQCNNNMTSNHLKPILVADPLLKIVKIGLMQGALTVKGYVGHQCFFQNGSTSTRHLSYNIGSLPYTFSSTKDTLKFVDCNTCCLTYCTSWKAESRSGCPGLRLGCCMSEIPNNLKSLEVNISRFDSYANSWRQGIAMIFASDHDDRKLADMDVPIPVRRRRKIPQRDMSATATTLYV